jgi:hypothetical protein
VTSAPTQCPSPTENKLCLSKRLFLAGERSRVSPEGPARPLLCLLGCLFPAGPGISPTSEGPSRFYFALL